MGITGNLTMAAWVKLNTAHNSGDWWVLFNETSASTNDQYIVVYDYNSGFPRLLFWRARGGIADYYAAYPITLSVGVWYHLALTYDGTTLRGYYNGSEVGNVASSGNGISGFGDFFGVGMYKDNNAQGNWIIDDAAIFSRTLSSNEVWDLYHGSNSQTGSTYSTHYSYNGLGNLTSMTDAAGNVRNFTYDGLGRRLTAEDLHASGDGTYGSYSYTYDDSGNLTQKVDPKSQTINYSYDDLNRQLTEDYAGTGGTEVIYSYDSCLNGKGNLCSASSTAATILGSAASRSCSGDFKPRWNTLATNQFLATLIKIIL